VEEAEGYIIVGSNDGWFESRELEVNILRKGRKWYRDSASEVGGYGSRPAGAVLMGFTLLTFDH
jgi:hypothetical protein